MENPLIVRSNLEPNSHSYKHGLAVGVLAEYKWNGKKSAPSHGSLAKTLHLKTIVIHEWT